MADYLLRAISETYSVIALSCVTTDLVEEARRLHGTFPTATAALGRALTGALMMGALLKRGQRVALKFEGDGPLKKIIAEADHGGTVRGFVGNPEVVVPFRDEKLNVSGALGARGTLTVRKDLGLKEPYTGIVNLLTGEIAEDIAYYYSESEQIPSAVGLGVFVKSDETVAASGGFLIQTLPPTEKSMVDRLIENIRKIPSVTEILRQGRKPESIFSMIFAGLPYFIIGKSELALRCSCSRERVEQVLLSLGKRDLQEIISEQGQTDVTCEYCRTKYHFERYELEGLVKEIGLAS